MEAAHDYAGELPGENYSLNIVVTDEGAIGASLMRRADKHNRAIRRWHWQSAHSGSG